MSDYRKVLDALAAVTTALAALDKEDSVKNSIAAGGHVPGTNGDLIQQLVQIRQTLAMRLEASGVRTGDNYAERFMAAARAAFLREAARRP